MIKKTIVLLIILSIMILTACGDIHTQTTGQIDAGNSPEGGSTILASMIYFTFEEIAALATDVVVVQYVTHRPFGRSATEFEFIVNERIFGNAADRIFIYANDNITTSVMETDISFRENELSFTTGTQYLLLLEKIETTHSNTNEDGFWILGNLVIDLENPSRSTMYNEPLSQHATEINFNSRNLSREMIVSYIGELTRNNRPSREPIRSDRLEDIIEASPYVLIVEIGEPRRLSTDGVSSDWRSTDIYYTLVINALKGDMEAGDIVRMVFLADTVRQGERHIIAIEPIPGTYSYFYMFTTRYNSLFTLDQLDEILYILDYQSEGPVPSVTIIDATTSNLVHEIGAAQLEELRFQLSGQFIGQLPTNIMVREHRSNWTATGRHLTNVNPRIPQVGYSQNDDGIWSVYSLREDWRFNPGFTYSVEFFFGNQSVIVWLIAS